LELGQLTQEAIQLQSLYDSLEARLEREPSDEEWCAAAGKINMEAIRQAIEAGTEAKNKLVTSNLRLVQGVVNVYIRNGLSGQYNAGDMMQEGIMVRNHVYVFKRFPQFAQTCNCKIYCFPTMMLPPSRSTFNCFPNSPV
jgi:DNA-directed RNA polymerase specialized sigma subunit